MPISGARETIVVFTKTSEPCCSDCSDSIGNIEVGGGNFENPDCVANKAVRRQKCLSTEACGLILMKYSIDTGIDQVYKDGGISPQVTHTLRRVDIKPIGGRFELLANHYKARGNPRLVVELESGQ
jgi:hypothetical protein